jgi:CHAD domain-containing protein
MLQVARDHSRIVVVVAAPLLAFSQPIARRASQLDHRRPELCKHSTDGGGGREHDPLIAVCKQHARKRSDQMTSSTAAQAREVAHLHDAAANNRLADVLRQSKLHGCVEVALEEQRFRGRIAKSDHPAHAPAPPFQREQRRHEGMHRRAVMPNEGALDEALESVALRMLAIVSRERVIQARATVRRCLHCFGRRNARGNQSQQGFPAGGTHFLVHSLNGRRAKIDVMHTAPQLALTSTYHPCNQVAHMLRGHVAAARTLLGAPKPSGTQIHAARQELKRARAALRLLRESIDAVEFRQGDAMLREAAHQLNDVRDCEVVLRVLSRLQDVLKDESHRPDLRPLRTQLLQERRAASAKALRAPLTTAKTLLLQAKETSRGWSVANDLELLTRAMQRTYRQGRACFHAAAEAPTDDHLHAWRRQVKYSAYQLEALGSLAPGRMRKRLRRCARLAKVLGRDHDLLLLKDRIAAVPLDATSKQQASAAIRRERRDLQRRALRLGKRLYRARPRSFQPLN